MDNGKVSRAKLSDLIPDDQNANLHSERGTYMVNTSLSKLGAGRSILIDKNNEIIAGNLTTEQAADIGIEDVVIVDTDGKTLVAVRRTDMDLDDPETGARQMAYADNRTADVSIDFDPERLKLDIGDGLDLSDWWQDFELEEMGVIEPDVPEDVPPQIDKAEELREKWGVETGQLWQLGKHRLMCGNAMDLDNVGRLIEGFDVDGVCTDPPYDLRPERCIKAIVNFSERAIVLCSDKLAFSLATIWQMRQDFIWFRKRPRSNPFYTTPVLYHSHILLMTKTEGTRHGWHRPRDDFPSVIQTDREYEDTKMGHGKSSEIFEEMLVGFPWKVVADPFIGTGSTILAGEKLGKSVLGMEIDPAFTAVALERLTDAGLEARLVE